MDPVPKVPPFDIQRFLTLGNLFKVVGVSVLSALISVGSCLKGQGEVMGTLRTKVVEIERRVAFNESARIDAQFVLSQIANSERRITAIETAQEGNRTTLIALLAQVSSIGGSLSTIERLLTPRITPDASTGQRPITNPKGP